MVPAVAAALIGAGSNVLSSLFNWGTQSNAAKTQYEYQSKLLDQQNTFNYNMWNEQNEYNSPSAQVSRYADAGLNPSFMMSGQNAVSASSVQSANPSFSMPANPNFFGSLGSDLVNAYLQAKTAEAQINKDNAEAEETRSRIPKNQQDVNTGKAQESFLNAQKQYQDLLSNWEKISQDERLEQLKFITSNYESVTNLNNFQAKTLEESLPYISKMKEAEIKQYEAAARLSLEKVRTEIATQHNLNAQASEAIAQAAYLYKCGEKAEAEKLLVKAQTLDTSAARLLKSQQTKTEMLKTYGQAMENSFSAFGLGGNNAVSTPLKLMMLINNGDMLKNAMDGQVDATRGGVRPVRSTDGSTLDVDQFFNKILKSLKHGYISHKNPNFFAFQAGK